jgi:hypothetical protein
VVLSVNAKRQRGDVDRVLGANAYGNQAIIAPAYPTTWLVSPLTSALVA